MMIHGKYWQVHLRWQPLISKRQLRRLEASLAGFYFETGVDGIDGQSSTYPAADEIRRILDAVRAARMRSDGLTGAIVPYGYKWQEHVGHGDGCCCREIAAANAPNTDACLVAEEYATTPPLVVWPSDAGVEP